jgi:hypothetical protein
MTENLSSTQVGRVEKIIRPLVSGEPEKVQIAVEGTDHVCTEIRIENMLTDKTGEKVRLKSGAKVRVTVRNKTSNATAG